MRTLAEVITVVGRAGEVEIRSWVERGWVAPEAREGDEPVFSDLDVARVCLICDLRHDLDIEEETVPVVLSLLDQLYDLRRQMSALTRAVQAQPEESRRAILDLMAQQLRRPRGPLG